MRWRGAIAVSAITLGWTTGDGLRAQTTADLDRVEAAIDAGELAGLRDELDRWLRDGGLSPEDLGRARFLRARLLPDADSARTEFLGVATDGRSSYGAHAWLRLAQLDLARGDLARAGGDLERLRSDYARSAQVPASWYWSGRAAESAGDLSAACDAFSRAHREADAAGDATIVTRAAEAERACAAGGLRFTLQIGAFAARNTAEVLATQARSAGFGVRIVREDDLEKVRVGIFGSPDAARLLETRLRDEGFTVAIVAAES